MSQVVRLARFEAGFVKKVVPVSNSGGGGGCSAKGHCVNGKNFGTGQKWSETPGGPLIEVVKDGGYMYINISKCHTKIHSLYTQLTKMVLTKMHLFFTLFSIILAAQAWTVATQVLIITTQARTLCCILIRC